MSINVNSDQAWLEWIEVQKRAVEALMRGDLAAANGLVDDYLSKATFADLRSDVLAFRASLYEQQGNPEKALEDFFAALELVDVGYQKYTLELCVGCLYEDFFGNLDEAIHWYLSALHTAIEDGSTAAGTVLLRFLKLRGEQDLSAAERRLAEENARHSWQLLKMEGEPDLQLLEQTALLLVEAQGRGLAPGR